MGAIFLTLFALFPHHLLSLDCSFAPPFQSISSNPKGTGLRIGRKSSILFTPSANASTVTGKFGIHLNKSSLLFQIKLEEPETEYYQPANDSRTRFIERIIVHQECTRRFIELVVITHCDLSKKIFFVTNLGVALQYEVISYDIIKPIVLKVGKGLVLSADIIECKAMDLNAPRYFVFHSFPVFYFPNNFVRVPAYVVSRINKTQVVYVITYRISNETILNNKGIPSSITIAYEASQRAFGMHFELFPISHTLGIAWLPANQVQRNGSLLRFQYTFLRNESRDFQFLEVHLNNQLTWTGKQQSLLMRVRPLKIDVIRSWRGLRLPFTHSAFRAVRHLTITTEGFFQTIEVGLEPDDSCLVPMVFHVLARSTEDRLQYLTSAFFESASLLSFDHHRRTLRPEADVRAEVNFCSPRLDNRTSPEVRWRENGLYGNWTTLANQSQRLSEYSLVLNITFPIFLQCEVQNLSLAIADSEVLRLEIPQVQPDVFCEARIQWSVVTRAGEQLKDVTWIRRHEPFSLRLDAHFPYFFSAKTVVKAEIPQGQQITFKRSHLKSEGEMFQLRQQWQKNFNDCRLFGETFRARILDGRRQRASAKMAILPHFCLPRIIEFKTVRQSTKGGQLTISCRIQSAVSYESSWGIVDNGKVVNDFVLEKQENFMLFGAIINFSSCEEVQLRAITCWFHKRGAQIVFRTLFVPDKFCERPMLYFLFLVFCVVPIISFMYIVIVLRECLLNKKQKT